MKKVYFLFLIAVVTWFAGCKSASKLYQKGNYDEAVQVAVKKLQKDPNDQKLNPGKITLIRIHGGGHNNLSKFDEYHNFIRDILKY